MLIGSVGVFWALASPPTAGPDERDHAVNANAVVRGQLVGDRPSAAQLRTLAETPWQESAFRSVDVPAIYGVRSLQCFAFNREVTAACLRFEGSDRVAPVLTPVSWYPPAYYAVVGAVSRPFPAGETAMYVMRFTGVAVMAALLASAVASLRRAAAARVRLVALLVGLTPMALFLGASVNPSGVEIAAGLALWASGVVLVREVRDGGGIDGPVALRVGIAATVLTLSRHDGPFWLGAILVTLALVAGRSAVWTLVRSRRLRIWAVVVAMCTAAQLAWVFVVGTLDDEHSLFRPEHFSASDSIRIAVGRSSHWYHEMVGWFGWLDTPSPMLTVVLWSFAIGGLLLLAVALGQRRWFVAALVVLGVTALLPVLLEYLALMDIVAGRWQGRYALPFVVGVPLLAAVALERDDIAARVSSSAFPVVIAVALGLAQVVALAQNLRRYTVGYDGEVWFFLDPAWSPPLGPVAVVVGFTVMLVLLYAWLLRGTAPDQAPASMRSS